MAYSNSEEYAGEWMITIMENLLRTSSIPQEEVEEVERYMFDTTLTVEKANEIMDYLKANQTRGKTLDVDFDERMRRV
tara:strand:+ start:29 stop:262 length:234 start_codon:yes stop_codon:yes gene_type:complete